LGGFGNRPRSLQASAINNYLQDQAEDRPASSRTAAPTARQGASTPSTAPNWLGRGNVFNNSAFDLYDVFDNNATLAGIVESGARTADGDLWGTVGYVAGHLGTPQYLPKTEVEAKCLSKLVKGVDGIAEMPKELKAYSMDSKTLLYDMLRISAADETAAWTGVRNVADYMLGLIRNGTITTDGLDGDPLWQLLMPTALAEMDIKTGEQNTLNLGTFMKNTTPDQSLGGLTPLQWQGKILNSIKTEKGARYE